MTQDLIVRSGTVRDLMTRRERVSAWFARLLSALAFWRYFQRAPRDPKPQRSERAKRRRRVQRRQRFTRRTRRPTKAGAKHGRSGYGGKLQRRVLRRHYAAMRTRTHRASERGRKFAYWIAERFAAFRLGCLRKNKVLKKIERPSVRVATYRRRQRAMLKGPVDIPRTRAQRKARRMRAKPGVFIDDPNAPRGDA